MAGDWIKMRVDLRDDPAVIAIAAATDLDEDTVVGKLHKLWSWANRHTTDGNAAGVTLFWIDRYLSATGFSQAMVEAGWMLEMTQSGGGIRFPAFDRHNSESAKRRALTAERVAKHRNAGNVTKCAPREEKRREEKSKEKEPAKSAGSGDDPPESPPGSGLMLATRSGTWELPAKKRAEYEAVYGSQLNVEAELLRAQLWLKENSKRRKTGRRGTLSFLTGWLNRAAESAGPESADGPTIDVEAGVGAIRAEVADQVAAQEAEPWEPIGDDIKEVMF